MFDIDIIVNNLKRPRLLVTTARMVISSYTREKSLPRLLHRVSIPQSAEAIKLLLTEEAEIEQMRKTQAAGYAFERHLDLLTAIMAEADLIANARRSTP